MSDKAKSGAAAKERRGNIFSRIALFVRQVVAELKKVVYPSRNELWTYFLVVIVFVLIIMAFVGAIDLLFHWLVALVFG